VAKLAMTREFLAGFHKLDKPVQKAVSAAFEKFASHTHAGLHLEKIENSRDPHIRTIRITDFWRGVVLAPTAGDEYCLVTVLPHDDAIDYAKSRAVSVNSVLGVLEIRNAEALDAIEPALDAVAQTTQQRLFAEVQDSDLLRLGIEPEVLPLVRVITDEAVLGTLANLLPDIQYTALTGLASGMSVEEVWAEVAAGLTSGETVDPADVGAAIARSGDRIVMVESREELLDMLDRPFVAWRTFLHPAQRALAYKTGYKGPTQVTGSAGTGKTVTALHRVAHLARSGCGQILLTTYTTTLAQNLADSLRLLVDDPAALARVETINLDKLAIRVVGDSLGQMPRIASASELAVAWTSVDASGFTPEFLIAEWERVILAQDINSLDGYLTTKRAGRGRLTGTQKVAVWNAIERYTTWLREAGLWTFLTVNAEAARLAAESAPRYRHIVVDESQDLHPSQWRLLRALAPAESDDLFLVGDGNQRIYGGQVSLRSLGINVVGRSKKLTICYRSTQEIVAWAAALLTGSPAETTNEADHSLDGYRSALHGRKPAIYAARDRDDEHANLAGQIEAWIADGVEPHAIAVAARTNWLAEQAATTLSMLGIETVQLGLAASVTNAVRVGTMHRLKGLEFRAVAVIGVEDGIVPHPRAITDPAAQAEEIQRERCLLFVACTRARDALYVSYAGTASGFLLGAVPSS
jgi:AAA domain/UvrD-like helicase C-terminal domain